MTENDIQISYKLNGKTMPDLVSTYVETDVINAKIHELFIIERIYEENAEALGESPPWEFIIVDQFWISNDSTKVPSTLEMLEKMNVSDVSYKYQNVTYRL